eukprot:scaffold200_cov173-Amphora_coffeaeformis.AAC.10
MGSYHARSYSSQLVKGSLIYRSLCILLGQVEKLKQHTRYAVVAMWYLLGKDIRQMGMCASLQRHQRLSFTAIADLEQE